MAAARIHQIDMTSGAILPRMLQFALPVAATNLLNLLFNAADTIVVGKFAGSSCMGAVGATGALVTLLVGGTNISLATNILVAQELGSRREDKVSAVVHSSIVLAFLLGLLTSTIGYIFSASILRLMKTPEDLLPLATTYLSIYFLGAPANMVYAFGSAVLRANGDTRRPFFYLILAGSINVVLNLVMVLVFHLDVAGVAIATVVSQYVSVIMLLICLFSCEGCCRLELRKLRFDGKIILKLLKIGIPASLQGMMFSLSNIITQSAVNSFGTAVVAANTASANIHNFTAVGDDAFYQGVLTFTGQNYGARKNKRIGRIVAVGLVVAAVVSLALGLSAVFLGRPLLNIYISKTDPSYDAIMEAGLVRLRTVTPWGFLFAVMMIFVGATRGMGRSWSPMLITMFGTCVLRIVWIYTVFRSIGTVESLYYLYAISWAITAIAQFVLYLFVRRNADRRLALQETAQTAPTEK